MRDALSVLADRRRGTRRPLPAGRLVAVAACAAVIAGCSSGAHKGAETGAGSGGTPVSIISGYSQQPSYADVRSAIDKLYRNHPSIASFSAQDVQYNSITRDKVLEVCRTGGPETDAATRESDRIAGCAPLIFFFYNYGRHAAASDAYQVAEKLYWYAVSSIKGPINAKQSLNALLKAWGIS